MQIKSKFIDYKSNPAKIEEGENVIFAAALDGRYGIEVERTGDQSGMLKIKDFESDFEFSESVILSFGAASGPDYEDVVAWQERCCEIVDGRKD